MVRHMAELVVGKIPPLPCLKHCCIQALPHFNTRTQLAMRWIRALICLVQLRAWVGMFGIEPFVEEAPALRSMVSRTVISNDAGVCS